jgi:hydroxyacylglutathione hydrolase
MAAILQIQAGLDNTFYLVGDAVTKEGIVIDPFDGDSALAAIERHGWRPTAVVNTHGHWDHVGGNDAIRGRYGVPVIAHPLEEVPHAEPIGDTLAVGPLRFQVLHTPGHRPGHVCLFGHGVVFTGDTLFVAGSGNPKFGGNVDQLFESFQQLSQLPDETRVYPGHNYAAKNLRFSAAYEPENPAVTAAIDQFQAAEERGEVHHSTIGGEKRWNLFFRLGSPSVRNTLAAGGHCAADAPDATVFRTLRSLRNDF